MAHSYQVIKNGRKQCSVCHKWLELKLFGINERNSSGLKSDCKKCVRICQLRRRASKRFAKMEGAEAERNGYLDYVSLKVKAQKRAALTLN